ncbi:Regulator of telomere elongation helicase 1 [Vitis vinifera]|uniref:Regulator of telomere elongation helicase 1 n=1 Tax=Vitis vinifera TaxID=29760 RepID=A0A438FEC3_VITVI|nr:Regulator of telomere elongation helicase 1 [Vitis vinifera]
MDFPWGGGALEKRPNLVKWVVVCSHKKKGGLGIRNLSILNRAPLCKWSWCFAVERESLWKLIISRKFGEKDGGWSSYGSKNVWVADCWDSLGEVGGWISRFSRSFNDWEVEAVERLLSTLQGKRLIAGVEDRVVWKVSKNEIFSVKSLYNSLDHSYAGPFPWNIIWSPCVPTKVGFFAWEASWGKVLTQDQLKRRGWNLANRCFLCCAEEETINHILVHCSKARVLWDLLFSLFGVNWVLPLVVRDTLLGWFASFVDKKRRKNGLMGFEELVKSSNSSDFPLCLSFFFLVLFFCLDFMKYNPGLGDDPIDIEDLVNIGRSNGPCPYYVSRELHKVVDILFAPYNYLIDRGNRKSLSVCWNNSILIFDEAHNLEGLCADAASFDLPSWLLTACISEAKNCVDLSISRREIEKANDKSCNPDNFAILRGKTHSLLLKLEKQIAEVPIESKELGFTRPGPYIYELLADLNITHKTATMLIDIIEEAALLLEEDAKGVAQKTKSTICRLETMSDILKIIFRDGGNAHAKFYRVHVQEVEANAADALKGKASRTLSWWCFNPGIAMQEFAVLGVSSIILTSGTLSPLESFAQELKLEFPVRLENPHVISSNQIWAGVVPAGPSGCSFNSSYRTRDSLEYKQELGNAIVNFARIVPDGLLVFFPSYYILEQCVGCWKNKSHANSTNSSTIWERICKHKQPVIEPRQSSLFPSSIEDYMNKLKDSSMSGAVFFAVCRGKVGHYLNPPLMVVSIVLPLLAFLIDSPDIQIVLVQENKMVSEGLDFADHAGRAVVITGIPFAMRTDPKVRLKREFLDQRGLSQKEGCKVLTGEEWYTQQASRAVNQAVGRVIRHCHDFGAIIFCDERFAHPNRQSQISLWIQPHIKCYSKFGDVVFTLTRFFRDAGTHGPPQLKSRAEDRG